MFRTLEYQERVLAALDSYIIALNAEREKVKAIEELQAKNPQVELPLPDFCKEAWESLRAKGGLPASRASIPFSPRLDGCGRPVPNAVFKVPTAGGKTWMAVRAVSRIMGHYQNSNFGFVLWIVPNEAIYTQTLKNLRNREHPYRQELDRSAANKVRIMEKTNRLDRRDVEENLCVMLLMLQSANRETKETLKMFQDRGDVKGFSPPEGDQRAHEKLLNSIPNLDHYEGIFPMLKDTLGNALRMIRPIVVVDEGHKAMSELALETLYGFNPSFALELTATPKDARAVKARPGRPERPARFANVLVEVMGRELDREEMIKMPINLDPRQGTDWRVTLNAAVTTLRSLSKEAKRLRSNSNRYIRPIMLVQVERTGKDQQESGYIHAEQVKQQLKAMGFDETEIAIKTAEQNDLNQPENEDLLSRTNRVRVIVTKQALQEGWDCPFAYVLCSLAASRNRAALTQLIGRILRQPDALRTGMELLDECHIVTHHAETNIVADAIKRGLEQDGLGDLVVEVPSEDAWATSGVARKIKRSRKFAKTEIYLPKVLALDGGAARELDYETDVLTQVDWRDFDPRSSADELPENAQAADSHLQRFVLTDDNSEWFHRERGAKSSELIEFDPAYATRMIRDLVPNPYVGREIVGRLLGRLRERGFSDRLLGRLADLVIDRLRKELVEQRDKQAESIFRARVAAGNIQFRLRADGRNWPMPFETETTEPEDAPRLINKRGVPAEKSLFSEVYRSEFNSAERDVAVYLDGAAALTWWHRNVARTQYGIQGWKRQKIYPDFLFAVRFEEGANRIAVIETKGDFLDNPGDTRYKRKLLAFLSDNFAWDDCVPAGEMELVQDNGDSVECALILISNWKAELPAFLVQTETKEMQ